MAENTGSRIHWSFWVIGVIALVWNVLGSINFFAQMNPDMLEAYRESERAIIENRPMWATVAFGAAVLGGAVGSLLLLLRKALAFYLFAASLLGVIVTMVHTLTADIDFGAGEITGIVLMPLAVAALLVWYSKQAETKGWIS